MRLLLAHYLPSVRRTVRTQLAVAVRGEAHRHGKAAAMTAGRCEGAPAPLKAGGPPAPRTGRHQGC